MLDLGQSLQDRYAANSICFGCGPANERGLKLKSCVAPSMLDSANAEVTSAAYLFEIAFAGRQTGSEKSVAEKSNDDALDAQRDNRGSSLIARFDPQPHHAAFPGVVNGGIVSALLDCHMNWTAAWNLMLRHQAATPPCCVTAKYEVSFKAPTPVDRTLGIVSRLQGISDRKGVIQAILGPIDDCGSIEQVTATGSGVFVNVGPDHPGFHRW